MDFGLTEEQELLLDNLREFVAREWSDEYYRECWDNNEAPTKFTKALAEAGFGALGIPEEYGGTPVDNVTLMLVGMETARLTGSPISLLTNALQMDDILTFGNEQQKEIVTDYLKRGEQCFSLGISEPQAGSDNNSLSTTAVRKDGKVYINGHKTYITDGNRAPYIMLMTRDVDAPDPKRAMSMWMIPINLPGVKFEPLHKIGHRTSSCTEIYFDDVEVDESYLLGKQGHGFIQLMKNFEIERLMIAAMSAGMAEAAFEDAVRYANERIQFGQNIGKFQLIQEKITYMKIKIENMKNLVLKTAWEKDNGIPIKNSCSYAKLYCAEEGFAVIDDAMQILGGIGYMQDHRISRLWADARMHRIGGGTDQIMIHVAGRGILKDYKKAIEKVAVLQ